MLDQETLDELIREFQSQHGEVHTTVCGDEVFIWRLLTKYEYQVIEQLNLDDATKEELVASICTLYPKDFDFSNAEAAGYASAVCEDILKASLFYDPSQAVEALAGYIAEMQDFANQMDCIIVEAFPYLRLEDVRNWPLPKSIFYLSRAQWILTNLRGKSPVAGLVPASPELQKRIMQQHLSAMQLRAQQDSFDEPPAPNIPEELLDNPDFMKLPPQFRTKDSTKEKSFPEANWWSEDEFVNDV